MLLPFDYNLLILVIEHAYMVCPGTFIVLFWKLKGTSVYWPWSKGIHSSKAKSPNWQWLPTSKTNFLGSLDPLGQKQLIFDLLERFHDRPPGLMCTPNVTLVKLRKRWGWQKMITQPLKNDVWGSCLSCKSRVRLISLTPLTEQDACRGQPISLPASLPPHDVCFSQLAHISTFHTHTGHSDTNTIFMPLHNNMSLLDEFCNIHFPVYYRH